MASDQPPNRLTAFVKRYALYALALVILAALAWSFLARWLHTLPDGLLAASGRIEGDETVIAPKIAGQITQVLKDKGDQVQLGDLLVRISSEQLAAQLQRAQDQQQYWDERRRQARVDLDYTRQQVEAAITESQARVAAAAARTQEAAARLDKDHLDYQRYQSLFARRVVPKRQLDEVTMAYRVSQAQQVAAGKERAMAEADLQQALLRRQTVEMKDREVQAAQASLAAAVAQVQEAAANLRDTFIYAPSRGVLLTKEVEPGEIVNPGTPLFTLVDQDKLYLKVYINEPDIGKIALGQEARIYVDAFPDRAFPARVSRVSPRAEFTPKYVETREERVKLVFAVELRADNPDGYLKPGMPGDGVIRLKDTVPWQRPH